MCDYHNFLNFPAVICTFQIKPKTRDFKKGLGQRFVLDPDEGFNTSLVQNRGLMYYHQVAHARISPIYV